jgi:pyruvate,water dikinase
MAKRPSILRRNLGSKTQKMIYGQTGAAGKSTVVVDVDKPERLKFSISDAEALL